MRFRVAIELKALQYFFDFKFNYALAVVSLSSKPDDMFIVSNIFFTWLTNTNRKSSNLEHEKLLFLETFP